MTYALLSKTSQNTNIGVATKTYEKEIFKKEGECNNSQR